jgi:hypothetical protein
MVSGQPCKAAGTVRPMSRFQWRRRRQRRVAGPLVLCGDGDDAAADGLATQVLTVAPNMFVTAASSRATLGGERTDANRGGSRLAASWKPFGEAESQRHDHDRGHAAHSVLTPGLR